MSSSAFPREADEDIGGTSTFTMNVFIREQLRQLYQKHGRALIDNPRACEAILKDLYPDCKRDVTVLLGALQAHVPSDLLSQSGDMPIKTRFAAFAQRLYERHGTAKEFAIWAVETWAVALGLLPPTQSLGSIHLTTGQNFTIDLGEGVLMEFIAIPGGTFLMGTPEELRPQMIDWGWWEEYMVSEFPRHQVTVAPFYLGKYPVTQAQWQVMMGNNPSRFEGANRPVEQIRWIDVERFIQRLNELVEAHSRAPLRFKLPSEAEWEYACRAGAETIWPFGDDPSFLSAHAWFDGHSDGWSDEYNDGRWFDGNCDGETHPVGEKLPNAFGLYDMLGNVSEYCADDWHNTYDDAPADGSVWKIPASESARLREFSDERKIARGGNFAAYPPDCRPASRMSSAVSARGICSHGVRIACSPLAR